MQSRTFPSREEAYIRSFEAKKAADEKAIKDDWLAKHTSAILDIIALEFGNPRGKFYLSYGYDAFEAQVLVPSLCQKKNGRHLYMQELFMCVAEKLREKGL